MLCLGFRVQGLGGLEFVVVGLWFLSVVLLAGG